MAVALQAVMFDMDGLLVDTEPLWFEVECEVMDRLGGDWSPADQAKLVGGSLERTLGYLLGKAGRPVPRDRLAQWLLDGMIRRLARSPVRLRPGALDLLAEVRAAGLPHALVTSSERVIMDAVFATTGLAFEVTVCAEDVTRIKPDPEPYLLGCKLLAADPAASVVLEDSPNGVAAAEAAGCQVIAVPNVAPVPPAPGRVIVSSLTELSVARLRDLVATALVTRLANPSTGVSTSGVSRCAVGLPASADAAAAEDLLDLAEVIVVVGASHRLAGTGRDGLSLLGGHSAAVFLPSLAVLRAVLRLAPFPGRLRRSRPDTTKASARPRRRPPLPTSPARR